MPEKTMPCPQCQGAGYIPLPRHLVETVAALDKLERTHKDGVTVGELWSELLVSKSMEPSAGATAVNNRLNALYELALAERLGRGTNGDPYRWKPWRGTQNA